MQVCKENPEFKFLLDDLILEEMDTKRVKTTAPKQVKEKEVNVARNSISLFFGKNSSVCF